MLSKIKSVDTPNWKIGMPLVRWQVGTPSWIIGIPLARWHVGMFIGTLARKNEKLARIWHVATLARGHVDHAGTYSTRGTQFSKLSTTSYHKEHKKALIYTRCNLLSQTDTTYRNKHFPHYHSLLRHRQIIHSYHP